MRDQESQPEINSDEYPGARKFLLVRTSSQEEASDILRLSAEYVASDQTQPFPKKVMNFFRTKPTGKSWWDNATDMQAFLAAVRSEGVARDCHQGAGSA